MEKISVLVVEDHPLYRYAVAGAMQTFSDQLELVGFAEEPDDALRMIDDMVPDVVVLDLDLERPGTTYRGPNPERGIALISTIRDRSPKTVVLVITMFYTSELVFGAIKAGAAGYMLKATVEPEQISAYIQQVYEGNLQWDQPVAKLIQSYFQDTKNEDDELYKQIRITRREQEVIDLVANGKTNKEIASTLNISEKTAKAHMHNILQKLHLRRREELIMLTRFKRGLKPPGSN